jgi:hypothetical protein
MRHPQAILTLAAIGALTLTSAAPPHHFPQCTRTAFVGITRTTGDGTVVGLPDPTDWGCAEAGGAEPGIVAGPRGRVAPLGVPAPLPTTLCMHPAYPNPADAGTWLSFALPAAAHASLSIYSRSVGHGPPEVSVVRTLIDADLVAGSFMAMWDLRDDHGARVAAGIYRAVLVVGDEALCGDIEVQ